MKHLNTLTFALLASIASISASDNVFENAFYVIKDGKLANSSVVEYDPSIILDPNKIVENVTAPDGSNAVQYQQITTDTKNLPDVKLKFGTPLDINQNYIMFMEYWIPASHAGSNICDGNKPLFIFGLNKDSVSLDQTGVNNAESAIYIDAKFAATDQWVQTYKYVYINPSVTSVYGMILSYARENGKANLTEFPLIKTLAFVPSVEGVRPFYAENFRILGDTWSETLSITGSRKFKATEIAGGIKPTITEYDLTNDNGKGLSLFRAYEGEGSGNQDGSGYLDDEHFHTLLVEGDREPITIENIPLPAGISQIHSEMLVKMYPKGDADLADFEGIDVPISFVFNDAANTEINIIEGDSLKGIWEKKMAVTNVPAGATTVTLKFAAMGVAYIIDDVILSSTTFTDAEDFLAENNAFEVKAYIDANGNIVVLNGELQAVYNLNGSVASVNDKAIIILVKNEEGKVAAAKLIRK